MLWFVASALAAPSLVRPNGQPTRAVAREVERASGCEAGAWTPDPEATGGGAAVWTVELCGGVHRLRVERVDGEWVVRELPVEAPADYVEVHAPVELSDEPVLGDPSAPIVVLQYSDFGCPHCVAGHAAVRALLADPRVQVRARLFPLDAACNPSVRLGGRAHVCAAAEAALCAHAQGKYWEYAEILLARQPELGEELFVAAAAEVGLDRERFAACRADPATRARLDRDVQSGLALGIPGVPVELVRGLRDDAWVMSCFRTPALIERSAPLPVSTTGSCM